MVYWGNMTTLTPPTSRRWTAEEYLRLAKLGFFDGQRVELIDGEIIQMSPIHNPHAAAVSRLSQILIANLPAERYWVRVQATLSLDGNYPEPDIAVISGPVTSEGDFPVTALFVAEISDSTLNLDRTRKMPLYAAAKIPEYWIINLPAKQIEIFRKPIADPTEPFGFRYGDAHTIGLTESSSTLFEPSLNIAAAAVIG